MGVVYKITNLVNGRMYVGQTRQAAQARWREHRNDARNPKRHSCWLLHEAMREFGESNFVMEVIDQALLKEELDAKEAEWVARLGTVDPKKGYNLTSGGHSGFHGPLSRAREKVDRRTPEARERQAAAIRGRKLSPERAEKLRLSRLGFKASPETIEKMRVSQIHLWTPEKRAACGQRSRERAARRKLEFPGKNPNLSSAMRRIWEERHANGAEDFLKKRADAQIRYWSDPHKREAERQKWTPEMRAEAKKKSEKFFASPEGKAAKAIITKSLIERNAQRRANWSEEDHAKASEAVKRGWEKRRIAMRKAA